MSLYNLTVKLEVEVDAPNQFDAAEMLEDVFGSSFGIDVKSITVRPTRKPRVDKAK